MFRISIFRGFLAVEPTLANLPTMHFCWDYVCVDGGSGGLVRLGEGCALYAGLLHLFEKRIREETASFSNLVNKRWSLHVRPMGGTACKDR
jgi:hypothetical protein